MDPQLIWIGLAVLASLIILGLLVFLSKKKPKPEPLSQKTAPLIEKGPTDLREALAGTRKGFWGRIETSIDQNDIDSLEEVLFTSDVGPTTAQRLFVRIEEADSDRNIESVRTVMREEMQDILQPSLKNSEDLITEAARTLPRPVVWLVVGVNGVGKTSTIGKLAYKATQAGLKVMIVAGDTFRAAADAQLKVWADRSGCQMYIDDKTKDPAAVTYAALEKAKAEKLDLVIVDTAGRLHTQEHLMEELKKVKKVIKKVQPTAPNETLIVLDANSGQNALTQAKSFHSALDLTGVVMTKLDGTSKGGVLLGVSAELKIPVRYIGVGESIEDLRPFDTEQFVGSIL